LKFFWQRNKGVLSTPHGVPQGTFRCDICGFVQPDVALCGTAADTQEISHKVYTLCSSCALWLGLGTSHFPHGTTFTLSARQHDKIKTLQDEIEKCGGFERTMMQITAPTDINNESCRNSADLHKNFEQTHVFLDDIPMLKSLIKFRFSMLSSDFMELSIRLTRGEPVTHKEINNANQ
jgi:hypothetical protein